MGEWSQGNQSPDMQHDQHVSSVSVKVRIGKNCDKNGGKVGEKLSRYVGR